MRIPFVILALLSPVLTCFADYRPDRDGAETSVSLRVVDTDGNPVVDAAVRFVMFTTLEKYYNVDGRTDEAGVCSVTGNTRGEVVAIVTKEGYYQSRDHLNYRDLDWKSVVAEHRWTHGTVANSMQLKKIVRPTKHLVGVANFAKPPVLNEPLSFDVKLADWCAPYGKGVRDDFKICYHSNTNSSGQKVTGLSISADNCIDGFMRRREDRWSAFKYDLNASATASYDAELKFGWIKRADGVLERLPRLDDNQYLVFRVRTSTNEVGEIVTSNYGIIYGFNAWPSFEFQLNPVNNDVSLEHNWVYRNMLRHLAR